VLRRGKSTAFTLVELLIVLSILASLVMLLLPAIQVARESSRLLACKNNLRQVGIALVSFEANQKEYPTGSRNQLVWPSGVSTMGTSWWVAILPYLEEAELAARFDDTAPYAGSIRMNPQNDRLIDHVIISVMFCPSSPLPKFHPTDSLKVGMPSYVGISGAANDGNFSEMRVSEIKHFQGYGEMSTGGMLMVNSAIRHNQITDGASHTIMVGETSEYCFNKNGHPMHVDGGMIIGWIAGTHAIGSPPNMASPRPAYNISTIRYPIGTRNYDLPGIDTNHGANNPLLSAHSNGAVCLLADGSVQFLAESTDILTLKSLATRDDQGAGAQDSAN